MKYIYFDAQGKQHFTQGRFAGWTLSQNGETSYASFVLKTNVMYVPEYLIPRETIFKIGNPPKALEPAQVLELLKQEQQA